MKKEFKKDGGKFQKAVSKSGMSIDEMQIAMKVSNGTFYRLYRKEDWSDDEKKSAARALGKSVSEIFDNQAVNKQTIDNNDILNSSLSEKDELDLTPDKTTEPSSMISTFVEIYRQQVKNGEIEARAREKSAEAYLLTAKSNERLTRIIEKLTGHSEIEGSSMEVKPMAH